MGLRNQSYAKIWAAREKGKIFSVMTTVSRKNKDTNQYDTQFSGYVNFAGEAAKKIKELGLPEKMDRNNPQPRSIQITDSRSPDLTNNYNAQYINKLLSLAKGIEELEKFIRNNASPTSVTIWDFELAEDGGSGGRSSSKNAKKTSKRREPELDDNEEEDSDLPF